MKSVLFLIGCLLMGPVYAGEISPWPGQAGSVYKWTDEKGRTHYTQYPPTNAEYEEVEPDYPTPPEDVGVGSAGDSGEELTDTAVPDEGTEGEASSSPPTPKKKTTGASQIEQNCIVAKKNLELLEAPGVLEVTNSEGKKEEMSDEARAGQIKTAKQNIEDYCK